jgi:excisionase family DNA binding protein
VTTTKLPPDLLSIAEAAARMGVSEATARRMARRGELPEAFHVGRQWRVSKPRLERRLHGDQFAPTPAQDPAPPRGRSIATSVARGGASSPSVGSVETGSAAGLPAHGGEL